ncbi:MAG: alpha/beta fold hydrolase [Planctomycetota bacterium]|jgi:pimeloyl-ACP methyl ester carboxylesterase
MEVKLVHGPLSYEEKGSGRPYILLNGFPFGTGEFTEVLDVLAWSSRAVAVDLPGIGKSEPLPEPTPNALAQVLLDAFANLGLDTFILGATDVAGPVAYEIMDMQPGLVAGVLLFNTCIHPIGLKLPGYLEGPKTTIIDLLRPTRRLENEIVCVMGKGERLTTELMEAGFRNLSRAARRQGATLFEHMLKAPFSRYRESLTRYRKPMRILWGGSDPLYYKAQVEAFRTILPEVQTVQEDEVGHFFGIEEPNVLIHTLQELGREAWS